MVVQVVADVVRNPLADIFIAIRHAKAAETADDVHDDDCKCHLHQDGGIAFADTDVNDLAEDQRLNEIQDDRPDQAEIPDHREQLVLVRESQKAKKDCHEFPSCMARASPVPVGQNAAPTSRTRASRNG